MSQATQRLALVFLFSLVSCDEGQQAPAQPAPQTEAAASTAPNPSAELVAPTEAGPIAAAASEPSTDARAEVPLTPPAAGPRSHVFGRIADAQGAPLAGVDVSLHSVGEPWADGVESPDIDGDGYGGYKTTTAADGRFDFDVPTPTSSWTSLYIQPDPFHDLGSRQFGEAGGRNQPPIVRGENDLGTFALQTTGSITGRVVDESGRAIAGAEVSLDDSWPGDMGRQGESDATGTYVIKGVPPGEYGVEAVCDGYLSAKSKKLAVTAREETNGLDFELARAPTITGLVVDESGAPLANVWVTGWPINSGRAASATTDAHGQFVAYLPQSDPYVFEAELKGYAEFDEERFGGPGHAPGANDVRIVLHRSVMTTFVVLDAKTEAPIERYALTILELADEWVGGPKVLGNEAFEHELSVHERGEFVCEADPETHGYRIRAPGYAPSEGKIEREPGSPARCILRLPPESGIRGRAMFAGQPVAQAKIRFWAASLLRYHEEENGGGPFDENNYYWSAENEEPDDLVFTLPSPVNQVADGDGRFAISGFGAGEYRLEVTGPGGERAILDPLVVAESQAADLGDVQLIAGATLRAKLALPGGVELEGVRLSCCSVGHLIKGELASDGAFVFANVPAGAAHVIVDQAKGIVTLGEVPAVRLLPGATVETTIDLRDRAACQATVIVRVNGEPAECVFVYLKDPVSQRGDQMRATDELGRSQGTVHAFGVADVQLRSGSSGMPLGVFEKKIDLVPGASAETTIDVACGTLEVEWPELDPPGRLHMVQIFANTDSPTDRWFAHAMPASKFDAQVTGTRNARFSWMPVGEREVTLKVDTVANGRVETRLKFRRTLQIKAGETIKWVPTESERVE